MLHTQLQDLGTVSSNQMEQVKQNHPFENIYYCKNHPNTMLKIFTDDHEYACEACMSAEFKENKELFQHEYELVNHSSMLLL